MNTQIAITLNSLITYIIVILFFPTFWGFLGKSGISLGQFIYVLSVTGIGCIMLICKRIIPTFPQRLSFLFLLLILSYAISLALNSFISNENLSFSDFTDLYRPISYMISLSLGYSLFKISANLKATVYCIVFSTLLCSLFDILKFAPSGQDILKLYTHLSPGSFNYQRFSGTFAYCYNYTYILIFGLLLTLFCSLRKTYSLVFIILVILAGSRSGLIACFVAIIMYYLMNKSFFAASFSIVRIIFFIGLIVYFISLMNIPLVNEILANVEKLSNALFGDGADGSLGTRNSQLSIALNNFYKSPIWGRGPLKGSIDPIEIQLGYYISSWGLMGITIYLTIMSLFLYYAWQTRSGVGDIGSFSKANFIWILCSFIIGLSTPITDQIRVSQFFFLIQGIQFKLYSTRNIIHKVSSNLNRDTVVI